jgi:hypothetical protein
MSETTQFALPLLAPSQAQKHVTVNEALARLDALSQLRLASRSITTPPPTQTEGLAYGLPVGPVNEWDGQGGKIAVFANGGWVFVPPQRGWRAWIVDEGVEAVYDGAQWRGGFMAISANGAGLYARVNEFEHVIAAGATSSTVTTIPANVMVVAVTGRVLTGITGTLSTWQLGNAGAPDRFGSGLGLAYGSFARGLLGGPLSYYSAEPLLLTATGGDFAAGEVRLAVHYLELSLPGV